MRALLVFAAVVLCGCAPVPRLFGVPRLEQVDGARNVWRSAQPETSAEWRQIAALGIKRDVVIRRAEEWPEDPDDTLAEWAGLEVVAIPLPPATVWETLTPPSEQDVERAVSAMELGDALVHCLHGVDRTGFIVARYKHEALGWPKAAAWNEALDRGEHAPWLLGITGAAIDWLGAP